MLPHCVPMLLPCTWCILAQRLRWEPSLPLNGSSCTVWGPSYGFWSTPHGTIMGATFGLFNSPWLWPKCCSTSSISTDQSNSRVKALAFCQICPGQEMPNTSGLVLRFSSCALTSLESLVFEAEDCLFGFSYCSPCWLAEGHSESKGTVRKNAEERGGGEMQQMGPKDVLYTAKVSVHVSVKRILCLLVYFCMQHATEKEEGFFVFVFP